MSLIKYIYHNDIDALAFQSCGNYSLSGKAIVTEPSAVELGSLYKEILFNLGSKLEKTKSNIPYIVGALNNDGELMRDLEYSDLKNKKFNKLIISCPVKSKVNDSININLLQQSIVVIEDYIQAFDLQRVVIAAPQVKSSDKIIFI